MRQITDRQEILLGAIFRSIGRLDDAADGVVDSAVSELLGLELDEDGSELEGADAEEWEAAQSEMYDMIKEFISK